MPFRFTTAARLAVGAVLSALLVLGFSVAPTPARADSAPADPADPATPTTVSADALPTVQINGVVWSQVVVGNTVYAAGQFTRARPAGAAPGTQETVRNNLLAYDIRTGELVTGFAPDLNGQAKVVTASPDGSRVYVGGSFTQANGQARYRIAAYSTSTGQLVNEFQPVLGATVSAIAATNTTVYVGGYAWGSAGGAARNYLAAFNASNGAVTGWAPAADSWINALLVTKDGGTVVVAGAQSRLNGVAACGIGAVSAATGQTLPWAAGTTTTNCGENSAFTALSQDSDTVFATGYTFGKPGNLEGMVAVNPATGAVRWIEDCRGDTYSVYATGSVEYVAGHSHDCANVGGWPQVNPGNSALWTYRRAVAWSKTATTTIADKNNQPWFTGRPAPSLLNWYPQLTPGSFTGMVQAAWSVTGSGDYVVYGGEFPSVNGTPQQGLVRFAVPSVAPNKIGPTAMTTAPTLRSWTAGAVRVSFPATDDPDNKTLRYDVYRSDRPATPVGSVTAASVFWSLQTLTFNDTTAPAGQTVSYSVTAVDAFGNSTTGPSASVTVSRGTVGGVAPDDYSRAVLADAPADYWRLGEASGSTLYDQAGTLDLTRGSGVTLGTAGALTGRASTAVSTSGTSSGTASTTSAVTGPQVFSVEAWFSTTSRTGGKIVGFGNATSGLSSAFDRNITINGTGRITFGVYNGAIRTIQSGAGYNNGAWHHVVGTLSSAGLALYVDGALVGTQPSVTSAEPRSGYWRIGGDTTWDRSGPYLEGKIDEVALYPAALSATQVAAHYRLGTSAPVNTVPTAAFTTSVSGSKVSFDASGSADLEGPVASYAWDFGDGQTGTGKTPTHTYSGIGTYPVKLTVTDSAGATGATSQAVTVNAAGTLAADAFERTANAGWGSADTGGAWTISGGASSASVDSGTGRLTAGPGSVLAAQLGISGKDVAIQADVALESAPTGGGTYVYLGGRDVSAGQYNAKLWFAADGTVWLVLSDFVDGAENTLGYLVLPGRYTAGTALSVRLDLEGTSVKAKAWTAGTTEPSAWQVTATDSTAALQVAGGLQVQMFHSGSATSNQVLRVDNVWVGPAGTTPTGTTTPSNTLPTASFTTSVNGLTATLDASASADAEGPLAAYAWDFGDGQTGSGATASHTYAAGGTYPVKLTVTDSDGAAATTTRSVTVTKPNTPPTAAFTATVRDLVATVDATTSTDAEGPIASYAWDFGDGQTGTGQLASHTYTAAGTYTVKLTVTDSAGATTSTTQPVTATEPPNTAPTAAFTSTVNGLTASVDAATSTDAEGPIASYAWDFGDGRTGTGKTATHTYAAAGSYTVTLTVTDGAGATDTASTSVTVAPTPNAGPVAKQTSAVSGLTVSVDGTSSTDSDGTVAAYAWDFGDGSTGTGATTTHTYASAGEYTVTLTVTDDGGATGQVQFQVTANRAPSAAFTSVVDELTATFDGSGSSDPDGPLGSYAWNFGDGSVGAGSGQTHAYTAAGTYTVTLTVTDALGATATATRSVTVTAPAGAVLARDAFGRTATGGWGTADTGGDWAVLGSPGGASVGNGRGALTAAAGTAIAAQLGVSATDVAVQADISLDAAPTGGGTYVSLGGRNTAAGRYDAKLWFAADGSVFLVLVATVNGSENTLGYYVLPAKYTAGSSLTVRLDISGTSLKAKAWAAGTSEPTAWQVSATDATAALQGAGGLLVQLYTSGSATAAQTVRVDGLWAGAAGSRP